MLCLKFPIFSVFLLHRFSHAFLREGGRGGGVSRIVQILYILLTLPVVTVVLKLAVLSLRKHGLCKF